MGRNLPLGNGLFGVRILRVPWGRAQYDQAEGNWALEHTLPGDPMTVTGPSRIPSDPAEGTLVGRIDIPRLDLSAVVFEGTSDDTLARGVGI